MFHETFTGWVSSFIKIVPSNSELKNYNDQTIHTQVKTVENAKHKNKSYSSNEQFFFVRFILT